MADLKTKKRQLQILINIFVFGFFILLILGRRNHGWLAILGVLFIIIAALITIYTEKKGLMTEETKKRYGQLCSRDNVNSLLKFSYICAAILIPLSIYIGIVQSRIDAAIITIIFSIIMIIFVRVLSNKI